MIPAQNRGRTLRSREQTAANFFFSFLLLFTSKLPSTSFKLEDFFFVFLETGVRASLRWTLIRLHRSFSWCDFSLDSCFQTLLLETSSVFHSRVFKWKSYAFHCNSWFGLFHKPSVAISVWSTFISPNLLPNFLLNIFRSAEHFLFLVICGEITCLETVAGHFVKPRNTFFICIVFWMRPFIQINLFWKFNR